MYLDGTPYDSDLTAPPRCKAPPWKRMWRGRWLRLKHGRNSGGDLLGMEWCLGWLGMTGWLWLVGVVGWIWVVANAWNERKRHRAIEEVPSWWCLNWPLSSVMNRTILNHLQPSPITKCGGGMSSKGTTKSTSWCLPSVSGWSTGVTASV